MTTLAFIIVLGILIFVHELGHFMVAKSVGVGVEEFSLGFGPRLFGFKKGETDYKVSALPLGGYVKLCGESADSEDADDPKAFSSKSAWRRFAIVFAGPGMNFIFALLIMPLVFMIGRPVPAYLAEKPVLFGVVEGSPAAEIGLQLGDTILAVDGKEVATWSDLTREILLRPDSQVELTWERDGQRKEALVTIAIEGKDKNAFLGIEPLNVLSDNPVVDGLVEGGLAAKAGLLVGDRILSIDGQEVQSWTGVTTLIQESKGAPITVRVARGTTIKIVPEWNESAERYLIGIKKDPQKAIGDITYKKYSLGEAIIEGTKENWRLSALTFQVLGRLVSGKLSYKSLGGPIRIAQAAGQAAKSGAANLLFLMVFLSLQLGILNLLPIPVLDGGHALFIGIEKIKGSPVSTKMQGAATYVGLFALLSLMIVVTINDINVVFHDFVEKVINFF